MSPTFRALRNPNYRLYLVGSVVSNTGTWMQRVAQDWLVLSLPGTGGTELGRGRVLADRKRRDEWLARQLRDLTPEERAVLRTAAPIIQRLSEKD